MRRGVSISVLAVFLVIVLAPLAQATPTWLPACCRTGGQHHCMGMPGADGFRSFPNQCPYVVAPAVSGAISAHVVKSLPTALFVAESRATALPAPLPVSLVFDNAHKRGPPAT